MKGPWSMNDSAGILIEQQGLARTDTQAGMKCRQAKGLERELPT